MLKGQLIRDPNGKTWENIDFLEKMYQFPDDKEGLIKEIQILKIEKGVLGIELEKTKSLLNVQQQIIPKKIYIYDILNGTMKNKAKKEQLDNKT